MTVREDPHAWLRPHFATVRTENASFAHLSPGHQFDLLLRAVQQEQPARAQEMREWSNAAQYALLVHLASTASQGHTSDQTELWR